MSSGSTFGILSTFDHLSNDWSSFKSRLSQWFIANDITDETDKGKVKRRAIILSALSESTFKLANDLALPSLIENVEYDQILKLLDDHCNPKRFGFAEKATFYSAVQRPGESPTEWAARIRGLAGHCGFKNLEEALLDKFIMGMAPGHERDKLFAQDQRELSLAKAVDMAESVRSARRAAAGAGDAPAAAAALGAGDVFAVGNMKCSVCGYTNHKASQCRFKSYKCKKCNQKGHLRRMCPGSKGTVNLVEDGGEGDDGEFVYNIRCERGGPMTERVRVGGAFLEFQVDSGSAVSLISKEIYNRHFSEMPLSPTNKRLFSYTRDIIVTCGVLKTTVSYDGKTHLMELFVVVNSNICLLGRDFIYLFNLQLAPFVNAVCSEENSIIGNLISKFPSVFSGKLGKFNKYTVDLRLKPDAKPIFFKARTVPFALREKIDKELDRLIDLGVLIATEHSVYASPVVPVLKKDGGLRLCADYSVTINKQLIVDKYPLPTVNEIFSKLNGGIQFSKIDLSMAYNQFPLSEESQAITTINTHRGLLKFRRLVFGLSSAPSIFQRAMECVLSGLEGVVFFLDDILVTGKNKDQHRERLTAVLQRLKDAGLTVQINKCEFFKDEICYLGHIINRHGIRKSPDKVKAVLCAPKPQNVSQLQSFLGLTNYYRNFLPDASSVLSPLYNLLHKNVKWEWTKAHDDAFLKIKQVMASDDVLTHFDSEAKLILTVDASPTGLAAILSQVGKDGHEKPVSYASRVLSPAERKYAQIQREATAIVFGVRRFHQYLYGRSVPFVLRTDHKPLLSIFGPHRGIPEISANRLQRYAIFLSAYNYIIEYIRSKDNTADYLSRASLPTSEAVEAERGARREECGDDERAAYVNFVLRGDSPVTSQRIRDETERDPLLAAVIRYVENGWPRRVADEKLKPFHSCRLQLSLENGLLMRGHKVVVPETLRDTVCNELHSSHFGIVKMKAEARKLFWFPGVDAALERLAARCAVCAALRPAPPRAPLAPWPHPPHAFYRVHLDFLGPLNNQMFLIVVDAYSKWVECYPMAATYGSKAVIVKLCDFMSRVGVPNTLVSDNGTSFTSGEFQNFCNLNGIKHILSPAYHPASNGQAESMVKVVKNGLKAIILENKNKKLLHEQISKFLFDYRNSKNSTTEKSPAELVYGRPLRSRLDLLKPSSSPPPTDLSLTVERNQCSQVRHHRGRERTQFSINDAVWIIKNVVNKKRSWLQGIIRKKIGRVLYLVFVPCLNMEVKRHIDQIRSRGSSSCDRTESEFECGDAVPDLPRHGEPGGGSEFSAGAGAPARHPSPPPRRGEEEEDGGDAGFETPPPGPSSTRRREISPALEDSREDFQSPTHTDSPFNYS